jgi:MipA family protein
MRFTSFHRPVMAAALCTLALGAVAQTAEPAAPEAATWGVGLGLISTQKPYAGMARTNTWLPLITFENQHVALFGPTVEVKLGSVALGQAQRLDYRLIGQMNLDGAGYQASDAPILAGMDERKGGVWMGAKAAWRNPVADVNAEWLADVSNTSRGQRLSLGLEKPWRLNENLMITPRVGMAWVDNNYVDYYFGVRTSETAAGRAAYAGSAGVLPSAGVRAVYRFDKHHAVMLDARVLGLADSIKASPLVNASTENRVLMTYSYRF